MKKFYLLFSLLAVFAHVSAQSCLPTGITFSSQSQIDNFPINYPGCKYIEGNVFIEQSQFGGITRLDSLVQLDSIGGSLLIRYNDALGNLRGLDKLKYVGGELSLINNTSLSSLNGLSNLKYIGNSLFVFANDALLDLGGLQGLTSIGTFVSISSNASMLNLRGLENLTTIGDNLLVQSNPELRGLNGLDNLTSLGRALRILNNPMLADLNSLGSLQSMGGPLRILDNTSLNSLNGLDKLDGQTITDLSITGSPQLAICEVKSICDYLSTSSNPVFLNGNASGCGTRVQIETACAALVGLDELNRLEVSVYPNPTAGMIRIEGFDQGQVRMLNTLGERILEKSFTDGNLDLSELPEGIYFLLIQSGKQWGTQKIWKLGS